MSRKLRVLHILWSGEIGGTEEYVTSLLSYFDHTKYEIYLCFLSQKGPIFEDALKLTDNVVYIGMNSGFDIIGALKLFLLMQKERFDIVHSHTTNILSNLIISLFNRPKKIFSEHVSPGANFAFAKRKRFYKYFVNLYQTIIAISEVVKQTLIENFQIDPNKIVVVHNGVRLDKFQNSISPPDDLSYLAKGNKRVLGFVGRMVDFKRPLLFIDIAAEIIKRDKNYSFVMVGDGPELEKCKRKIHHYQIDEYFKLLGFRRDIPNILMLFDALLFTSVGEGFGIVLIEAMAMGIPVFAVNGGAVPEIITHKVNGILFDSVDTKIIAQQISGHIEDKKLMSEIKKRCVEDVHSKFSINACVNKIEKVYADLLQEKNDKRG